MADNAVRIVGLRELERAFKLYGRGMERGLREAMEAAAEVVRPDAEALATRTIKRSAVDWTRMRVGVLRRIAYVAPVQRGSTSRGAQSKRRPALKRILLEGALEPALEQNVPRVEQEFSDALDDLARMWSRV